MRAVSTSDAEEPKCSSIAGEEITKGVRLLLLLLLLLIVVLLLKNKMVYYASETCHDKGIIDFTFSGCSCRQIRKPWDQHVQRGRGVQRSHLSGK